MLALLKLHSMAIGKCSLNPNSWHILKNKSNYYVALPTLFTGFSSCTRIHVCWDEISSSYNIERCFHLTCYISHRSTIDQKTGIAKKREMMGMRHPKQNSSNCTFLWFSMANKSKLEDPKTRERENWETKKNIVIKSYENK